MSILNLKIDLGFFPTPLHELRNLSNYYSSYNLYIKRDDNSGLASGGNKVRKLEYLMYDAVRKGCDTIITAGAQQSNHCRQTAAACAQLGLECHLLLGGDEPKEFNGNLLLSNLLGATIHFTGDNRKGEDIENVVKILESNGKKLYKIPYGGSNFIGALGFVNAVKELKTQLEEMKLQMDYIFFASSSGGTQSGLILGVDLFEMNTKLMPISIDKEGSNGISLDKAVLELLLAGKNTLKLNTRYSIDDAKLIKGYDKLGYGIISENEKKAIKMLAHHEGILLDPVYSGRAFYGMIDHIEKNKIPKGSTILFWHTGGLPANFYYSKDLYPV
ncbi:D-cysteine desulfhydrase [Algibacter agarivorans]|uniref:D-cysteine desulfhydrase n=1 Tax=Algibacter agarivorans TaxID=1109741 RepID=A0ABP9H270_9FLAO